MVKVMFRRSIRRNNPESKAIMHPKPQEERSNISLLYVLDKVALITGADSGIGRYSYIIC